MSDFEPETTSAISVPRRDVWQSMKRGWRQKCPSCGEGSLYGKFLKVNDACPKCGTELFHQRADDAPPYFVMTITAHVIVGGILVTEKMFSPPVWVELAIWLPLTALLSLWLLPRIKATLIGYQWALRMHGFGNPSFDNMNLSNLPPSPSEAAS
jgi:uncharacterized protein (DUF983 family)